MLMTLSSTGTPAIQGLPPAPTCYTYVMAAEDGARVYGSCVIFWERITDPESLSLISGTSAEAPSNYSSPRCICLISHWGFLETFEQALTELYRLSMTEAKAPLEAHVRHLVLEAHWSLTYLL